MNRIRNLGQRLIQDSYLELTEVKIRYKSVKSPDAYFEFTRNSQFDYLIEVDKSIKKAPENVAIGGLAHELSHIVLEVGLNPILSKIEGLAYGIIPLYQTFDERRTDTDVINRGYGEELLAFTKFANKRRRHPYNIFEGLTVSEIKKRIALKNNLSQ